MKRLLTFLICFSVLIFWSSCRNDFEFSPSTGNLEFARDTVYLDTVFTNIGSSTYNLKVYNRSDEDIVIIPPPELDSHILKTGTANGPLWGGNLSLLMNRLGTDGQINTNGCILFLEDLDEYLYSFERMLVHLQAAGVFNNINGLIIGELINMKDQDVSFGKSTDEIIMEICGNMDIPIVTNFPCGHGKYQTTLPISLPIELCADETVTLKFLESAVTNKK